MCPENAEDFIAYLLEVGHLDEAAVRLVQLINNDNFTSRKVRRKENCIHSTLLWLAAVAHIFEFYFLILGQVKLHAVGGAVPADIQESHRD